MTTNDILIDLKEHLQINLPTNYYIDEHGLIDVIYVTDTQNNKKSKHTIWQIVINKQLQIEIDEFKPNQTWTDDVASINLADLDCYHKVLETIMT